MKNEFDYQPLRETLEESGMPSGQASVLRRLNLMTELREAQLQGRIDVLQTQVTGLRNELTAFGIVLVVLVFILVIAL
jgi:hypothetical protein